MSELRPPTRWKADDSGDVPESFLEAARGHHADGPDLQLRSRMWEKLERDLAVTPAVRSWQVPWVGVSVLLLAGAGAMLALRAAPSQHRLQPMAAQAASIVASTPPDFGVQVIDDHALIGGRSQPESIAELAPATESGTSAPEATEPQPSRRRGQVTKARSPATESPLPASTEVALLVRARRLLQSQPARALELTQLHGQEYPGGVFAEERELLAIEALHRLGRFELAGERGARFLATFPASAHRRRVEALRSQK